MTRCSSRTQVWARMRLERVLLTSALALVLTTLPGSMSTDGPPLGWQTAVARGGGGDGPGGGNGNGHGGGRGDHGSDASARGGPDHGPGRGHGYGQGRDHGGQAGDARGYHDLNEFVDSFRSGKALGLERRDERIDQARGRYEAALGRANQIKQAGYGEPPHDQVGPAAHGFSPEETKALMERGWKGPSARSAGFRNHGERVRTMVELSKRLGYGAHVGALQANFGTPYENDIAALQDQLTEAQATGDVAEVERLEAELAEAIENAKPGQGPDDSWATADLDVNDDGVVDKQDLEALEQNEASTNGRRGSGQLSTPRKVSSRCVPEY
jgi:hypothetical protein